MPPAFKTVAVVGKSDAPSLPDVLDQLAEVLRAHGMRVIMDPATAKLARVPRRSAITSTSAFSSSTASSAVT